MLWDPPALIRILAAVREKEDEVEDEEDVSVGLAKNISAGISTDASFPVPNLPYSPIYIFI